MRETELKYLFNLGSEIDFLAPSDWIARFYEKYGISGDRKLDDVLEERVMPLLEFCVDASLFFRLKKSNRFFAFYTKLKKILYVSFIKKELF